MNLIDPARTSPRRASCRFALATLLTAPGLVMAASPPVDAATFQTVVPGGGPSASTVATAGPDAADTVVSSGVLAGTGDAVSTVAEPQTYALMLAGLAVGGFLVLRRR